MTIRIGGTMAGALLLAGIGLTGAARAEPVTVHHVDIHPATLAAADRTVHRIDDAALRACGVSGFSLTEVKAAIRAAPCWQDATRNVVEQSGDPLLALAFARFAAASR